MLETRFRRLLWIWGAAMIFICVSTGRSQTYSGSERALNQDRIQFIQSTIRAVLDTDRPIDMERLIDAIEDLPSYAGSAERKALLPYLGEILLYDGSMSYSPIPLTGCDPKIVLNRAIIHVFSETGDGEHVEYLQRFYRKHGGSRYPELPRAIEKTGGSVPVRSGPDSVESEGSADTLSAQDLQRRRSEVEALLAVIDSASTVSIEVLDRSVRRIGQIGQSEDVLPIIGLLDSADTHWVVRQNAIEALGQLGGNDAVAYLIELLQEPAPNGAELDDDGDIAAVLKAQAALALGECGDASVIDVLISIEADKSQFHRVRQACRKARAMIEERLGPEE